MRLPAINSRTPICEMHRMFNSPCLLDILHRQQPPAMMVFGVAGVGLILLVSIILSSRNFLRILNLVDRLVVLHVFRRWIYRSNPLWAENAPNSQKLARKKVQAVYPIMYISGKWIHCFSFGPRVVTNLNNVIAKPS